MLMETPTWFADASCLGKEDLFFSSRPNDRKKAVNVCQGCSYITECLDFAKSFGDLRGVWAGLYGDDLQEALAVGVP